MAWPYKPMNDIIEISALILSLARDMIAMGRLMGILWIILDLTYSSMKLKASWYAKGAEMSVAQGYLCMNNFSADSGTCYSLLIWPKVRAPAGMPRPVALTMRSITNCLAHIRIWFICPESRSWRFSKTSFIYTLECGKQCFHGIQKTWIT